MAKSNPFKSRPREPATDSAQDMMDHLEIQEYMATTVVMPAGAYNPYERPATPSAPAQRPKQPDLRKLSEWIKTRRTVEELARENSAPDLKRRR
jgi:hypothetical protein